MNKIHPRHKSNTHNSHLNTIIFVLLLSYPFSIVFPQEIIPENTPTSIETRLPDKIQPTTIELPILVETQPAAIESTIPVETQPTTIVLPIIVETQPAAIETSIPVETQPGKLEIHIPDKIKPLENVLTMTNIKTLSMHDAILLAAQNNPDLEMAMERKKRAGFSVQAAQAKFFPTLEFKTQVGWRYLNPYPANEAGDGDNSTEGSSTLLLKQLVFDGFTSNFEVKRNKQIENTTEIENKILIEEITSETIDYYFKILQFQETTKEASLFINAMEAIMSKITLMQEIGAASMIELDFSRARLASAKSANISAKSSLKDAISNLEYLLGPLGTFRVKQPYDINQLKLESLIHYVKISRTNNNQIKLNQSLQKTASYKIESAKGNFYPTVNFVIEGKQGFNEFGGKGSKMDSSILLQTNYLIYDAGKRQSGLNKANSKYREQKIATRQFERELNKGIKLDFNQASSIKQTLVTINDEINANEKLQKFNQENLELGEIKIIELIEVEERLFNSKANKHQKLSDFYINYYNLMTKSGLIKDAILPP